MKTSPPTSPFIKFGFALSALGIAISWPNQANAQVAEPPPHRIEFTVSPGLPKCDDYDGFYGILVNWVRVQSIEPGAKRKLIVDIKRLPDGKKHVNLSLLDAEGVELEGESHRYPATEECFKVLYWTAMDAAKLLRTTIPPPVDEPPMSVDKLVEESEKPNVPQDKRAPAQVNVQIIQTPPDPQQTQCSVAEQKPQSHLIVGVGVTTGLIMTAMPGLRFGYAKALGTTSLEFDVRAYLPIVSAERATGPTQHVSARGQAYLASAAWCLPGERLIGCLVAAGGVGGYTYDKPYVQDERYSRNPYGVFDVGLRMGARFGVHPKFALRVDLEAMLPIYRGHSFSWDKPQLGGMSAVPSLSSFISIIPIR